MASKRPAKPGKGQSPFNGSSTSQPARSAAKATAPKGQNPFQGITPKPTAKKPAAKKK